MDRSCSYLPVLFIGSFFEIIKAGPTIEKVTRDKCENDIEVYVRKHIAFRRSCALFIKTRSGPVTSVI